jgi:hypothetical protein
VTNQNISGTTVRNKDTPKIDVSRNKGIMEQIILIQAQFKQKK